LHFYSIISPRLLSFRTDQFSLFIPAEVALQRLSALEVKQPRIFLSELPYYVRGFSLRFMKYEHQVLYGTD
jgi:hypothetical protein